MLHSFFFFLEIGNLSYLSIRYLCYFSIHVILLDTEVVTERFKAGSCTDSRRKSERKNSELNLVR